MTKMSEMRASTYTHAMIYGPPKSGKTQLVGGLSKEFDLIWFDLEAGRDTLFKLPQEQLERIEMLAIPDNRALPIASETCIKVMTPGAPVNVCAAHGKVSCPKCWDLKLKEAKPGCEITMVDLYNLPLTTIVVFDSITQFTNSTLANITRKQPEDYKPTIHDWAHLGMTVDKFLSFVQTAPFHIACISHEAEVKMNSGKDKLVPVAGTKNFSRNAAKYFGEVIYCEIGNKKHVFASSTTYKNNVMTGSRTDAVMESQDKPSLIPLFKKSQGSV